MLCYNVVLSIIFCLSNLFSADLALKHEPLTSLFWSREIKVGVCLGARTQPDVRAWRISSVCSNGTASQFYLKTLGHCFVENAEKTVAHAESFSNSGPRHWFRRYIALSVAETERKQN